MTSYSESLKILNQKKVNMSDLSKVYKNVKGKIEGVTWQGVRTKASRPILKELLKSKIQDNNKKFIKKVEKKRKREDDEEEAQRAEVEKIGKNIRRVQKVYKKKDRGQTGGNCSFY